jgi:hypothetical protein
MKRALTASLLLALAVATAGAVEVAKERAYGRAVREDAARRGFDTSKIRYPAHWPLDFFEGALSQTKDPESAEGVVSGSDSTRYYILPVNGTPADSALLQAFFFHIDGRSNAIQVTYRRTVSPTVDGSDAIPSGLYQRPRDTALNWWKERVQQVH